ASTTNPAYRPARASAGTSAARAGRAGPGRSAPPATFPHRRRTGQFRGSRARVSINRHNDVVTSFLKRKKFLVKKDSASYIGFVGQGVVSNATSGESASDGRRFGL